jgi:hypothetical protein
MMLKGGAMAKAFTINWGARGWQGYRPGDGPICPRSKMPDGWGIGDQHDQRLPSRVTLSGLRLVGQNHQRIYQDAAPKWPL